VYPMAGEFERLEMIEVMGLEGFNYSQKCDPPDFGMHAVRYPVAAIDALAQGITPDSSRGTTRQTARDRWRDQWRARSPLAPSLR